MTRTILLTAATLGFIGAQAMAQTLPEIADTDSNGLWSLGELQTAYPDLGQVAFDSIDANDDGGVDVAELTAAIADGALAAAK
ncbi:MAG: EF-hand domain-containing protein [Paracoccaceae bacterium]|nr:EF-hand domain-containing protein [Paracoccaceae bacterium]